MPPPLVAAVVSAVVTAVVTTVITVVVEEVIEAVFGKENTDVRDEAGAMAQATTQARALLVNKNSNNAEIPVIYGKLRTGGTRVYMETSNNSGSVANNEAGNEWFNCIIAMCEGKMGNIRESGTNHSMLISTINTSHILLVQHKCNILTSFAVSSNERFF